MNKKQKDITELIKLYALNAEQKNSVIPGYVRVALEKRKLDIDPEIIISEVWNKVSTDEFIEKFVPLYDSIFSEDEIKFLLNFYKSKVNKKFEQHPNLLLDIFNGFSEIINQVLDS